MSLLAKKYQQASFRGVPFFVRKVDGQFGRRTADHEYPKRNTPHSEDLGRKARVHTFEAYVLGDDYEASRDALITACEAPESGPLVHPYLGRGDYICSGCGLSEENEKLGLATFTLSFREAGKVLYPAASSDDLFAITAASTGVLDAASANFTKNMDLTNAPGAVLSAVQTRVGQISDLVNGAAKQVRTGLQNVANFAYAVRNLKAQVRDLINTPAKLAQQTQDTIALLSSVIPGNDRTAARIAFGVLYKLTPATFYTLDKKTGAQPITVLPADTAAAALMLAAENALIDLVRRTAIANASVEAVTDAQNGTYASLDDAQAVQSGLTDELDSMAIETASDPDSLDTDDEVYNSLQRLRAQVFKSIPGSSKTLPDLISFTPPQTIPSLVLTYDLYESVNLDPDLIAQNKIRHPGFVTGGVPLKVLSEDVAA